MCSQNVQNGARWEGAQTFDARYMVGCLALWLDFNTNLKRDSNLFHVAAKSRIHIIPCKTRWTNGQLPGTASISHHLLSSFFWEKPRRKKPTALKAEPDNPSKIDLSCCDSIRGGLVVVAVGEHASNFQWKSCDIAYLFTSIFNRAPVKRDEKTKKWLEKKPQMEIYQLFHHASVELGINFLLKSNLGY